MELSQIIYGLAIIILAAFIAREKIREIKLTRQHGLKANPERCAIHETKINQLQDEMNELRSENKKDHEKIFLVLEGMRERVARVEATINGYRK
ncbi:MAG: hypothetical protein QW835_07300 [Candidatus Hadarchaeum sp.]